MAAKQRFLVRFAAIPEKIPAVLCCPAMCIAVTAVAAFLRLRQEKRITRQTAVPVAWRSTSAITGPTTYRAEKVDAVVSKLIRDILQKAGAVSEYDIVQNQIGATASDLQQQIRQAKLELSKKHIEQGRWEGLMLDSLDGKCPFTPEQVKSRLDSVKEAMTSLTASIESLETRLADSDRLTQELKEQHQQLLSWAEMFDTASPAERKLIASHLIRAVTLTRGYGIQIDFNISEAQYLNGMEL